MTNERRIEIEQQITRKLIETAVAAGLTITVDCGEALEIVESKDVAAIVAATRATNDDRLLLYRSGQRVGWVYLVYGNGADVLTDWTDNEITANIAASVDELYDVLCTEN